MDPERDSDPTRPEQPPPPADADLLPTSEPDPELALAYAAWRLDRPEETR